MQTFRNFSEVNRYLSQYSPTPKQFKMAMFSLDSMRELLEHIDNPQEQFRAIHVAGTSGKTSTTYYIASILKAAGLKVGMTVSPHIDEVNERVQIDMIPLPEKEYCNEFAIFMDRIEAFGGPKPSYFVLLVAFAYWEFARQKVDYAVVEVGMGGLLDATNTINRSDKVCVITDIGLDHTEFLGDNLPDIAMQKAGIIHQGNSVFMNHQSKEIEDVIKRVSIEKDAILHMVDPNDSVGIDTVLPLFQQRNWGLAKQVFEYIRHRDGLKAPTRIELNKASSITIPARMETINMGNKILIMDGAHNAHKLSSLAESINSLYPGRSLAMLIGLVETGDDRASMYVDLVCELASHVIVTSFDVSQDVSKISVEPGVIADLFDDNNFTDYQIEKNPKAALELLLKRPEDILLVSGSFFLINNLRSGVV